MFNCDHALGSCAWEILRTLLNSFCSVESCSLILLRGAMARSSNGVYEWLQSRVESGGQECPPTRLVNFDQSASLLSLNTDTEANFHQSRNLPGAHSEEWPLQHLFSPSSGLNVAAQLRVSQRGFGSRPPASPVRERVCQRLARDRSSKPSLPSRIAVIGNYLPRQCGIATFTTDLCEAISAEYGTARLLALPVNDTEQGYDYPARVRWSLAQDDVTSYQEAAEFLNFNNIDMVCLQHEYGIFGGPAGSHILHLLRGLKMPVVTTLHTVLREPES